MLDAVERLARDQDASRGMGYAFSGQSYQERASGGEGNTVFVLGLIMVFLVLAAQYESWSIPFAILLGVPFGTLGALLGVWLRGMANDVYVPIGLLVVIGHAAGAVDMDEGIRRHTLSRGRPRGGPGEPPAGARKHRPMPEGPAVGRFAAAVLRLVAAEPRHAVAAGSGHRARGVRL